MSPDFPVTIYHNARCGTSRNTIALVEAAGYVPTIVPYLEQGWTRDQLTTLAAKAGVGVRDFLRAKEALAKDLGLLDAGVTDDAILDAMVAHPILVNRPIVETPKGVKLCRPAELVYDLLDRRPA